MRPPGAGAALAPEQVAQWLQAPSVAETPAAIS